MTEHLSQSETSVARGFWAQAHVDGERVVTETGETVLSALALLQYVVNELGAGGDIEHGQIEVLIKRAP